MTCRFCYEDTETRNINLYVLGSEGLELCHACEMSLVNLIREMMGMASRAKLALAKNLQRVREAKRTSADSGNSSGRVESSIPTLGEG